MSLKSFGFKEHFQQLYKGTIQDPLLNAVLEALDQQSAILYNKFLLESYSQKKNGFSDGYYEVLRQNLLGPLFPGPVYSIAEVKTKTNGPVITLDEASVFEYNTEAAEVVNFTPCSPTLVVPSASNEVHVAERDGDLWLGFPLANESIKDCAGSLLLHIEDGNIEVLSKLRCFPWAPNGEDHRATPLSSFQSASEEHQSQIPYPGGVALFDHFRNSPAENEFLKIPLEMLRNCEVSDPLKSKKDALWLKIKTLSGLSEILEKNLRLNCFPVWNMFRANNLDVQEKKHLRYAISLQHFTNCEIVVHSVRDQSGDEVTEYLDCKKVLDPSYPFQYQFSRHYEHIDDSLEQQGEMRLSKKPKGFLRVEFDIYDKREDFVGLKPTRLEIKGLQEHLTSIDTIKETSRLDRANDDKLVWEYFRSALTSRNRLLSEADIRYAIRSFPPFSFLDVDHDRIDFHRKIGRVNGQITPYTEITIPVVDPDELESKEREYYENSLSEYLIARSITGQFLKVKIVK